MASLRSVGIVEDPRYREHTGPQGHPERPERLVAVGDAIAARGDALRRLASRPATPDEILRIHSRTHLEALERATQQAPVRLDPDTYFGPRSLEVSQLAAGAAIDLVLMPLTAFDAHGHRLGMGGGYYDRTFSFRRGRAHWLRPRLVGVAWAFQRVDALDVAPWDVPMDAVATDRGVTRFSRT